jgi:hypothetical protein
MPDARLKKRTGRQSMIAMARVNPSGRGREEGKRFLNVLTAFKNVLLLSTQSFIISLNRFMVFKTSFRR